MKLRVVGWTYYDDDIPEGSVGWAARTAVVDDIKKNGYLFSGWAHQESFGCTPVLNDGKMRCFSQRGWGDVMAEAHGKTGRMDYALYAFEGRFEDEVRPTKGFDEDNFIPETDLNERFELEVEREFFDTLPRKRKIKLDDLPSLRYLDAGDTLAFTCDGDTLEFTVTDVDRDRDLTYAKRMRLEIDMYDMSNTEKYKRAEEEFNNTKIVIIASVKKISRK